LQKLYFYTYF